MKVLVVDDDAGVRVGAGYVLHDFLNLDVIEASSVPEAIGLAKKTLDLDCVICAHVIPGGPALKLYDFFQVSGRVVPFIVLSPDALPQEYTNVRVNGFLKKPFDIFELRALVQSVLGLPAGDVGAGDEYTRVRVSTLLSLGNVPFELFVRLGEAKFIKLSTAGDSLSKEDLSKYADKHVEFLYIQRRDREQFLEALASTVRKGVQSGASPKPSTMAKGFEIALSAQEGLADVVSTLGLSDAAKQIIKGNVDLVIQSLNSNAAFVDLLSQMEIQSDSYISSHSVMVSYTACGLVTLLDWSTEHVQQKLAYAAVLHDLPHREDAIARLEEGNEYLMKVSGRKVEDFEQHPLRAAKLVQMMPEIPDGVAEIVAQHHELPDGTGYPGRLLHSRIEPLSAVFIIAERLVHHTALPQKKGDLAGFVSIWQDTFARGDFKRIMAALHKASDQGNI